MSEQPSGVLPPHPEVKRDIDVIPVTPHTKDRLLKIITGKVYEHTSSQPDQPATPQRLGVNFTSGDGRSALRLFLLPLGESIHGTLGGILLGDNNGEGNNQPLTQYLIKENLDPEETSYIIEKRIVPPSEFVNRNSEFPPTVEGAMIEHMQRAFDPEDAEKLRERMGHVTREQIGPVFEVTEGEIRDVIDEISHATIDAK